MLFAQLILFICLFIGLLARSAVAQTMSNKDYIIKIQGFNTVSGVTTGDYKLRSTAGEFSPGVYEGVDFKVKSGFENIASNLPFSASLSSDIIDFGTLKPTNPAVRNLTLSVYSLSLYGYSVIASEDHPLRNDSESAEGQIIPDTTCDNGQCNHENEGLWINTLTYGFGYRCDNVTGKHCNSSFSNSNFYKHFADTSTSASPQSVMSGIGSTNKDVKLSYKVNISSTYPAGIYSNIITFVAVPNF